MNFPQFQWIFFLNFNGWKSGQELVFLDSFYSRWYDDFLQDFVVCFAFLFIFFRYVFFRFFRFSMFFNFHWGLTIIWTDVRKLTTITFFTITLFIMAHFHLPIYERNYGRIRVFVFVMYTQIDKFWPSDGLKFDKRHSLGYSLLLITVYLHLLTYGRNSGRIRVLIRYLYTRMTDSGCPIKFSKSITKITHYY